MDRSSSRIDYLNNSLVKVLLEKKLLDKQQIQKAWLACSQGEKKSLGQYLIQQRMIDTSVLIREMRSIEEQCSTADGRKATNALASISKSSSPSMLGEGKEFAGYNIIREIARGGMGIVYLAKELGSKRTVALKILLSGGSASEEQVKRFFREAQASSSLNHPNIVKVYSMGEEGGYHYFTMDYIEGNTFEDLIKEKAPLRTLIKVVAKMSRALSVAHQKKIIHRDIKPSNILIDDQGEPYLTDFGLAKSLDSKSMVTQSGATLGTPFYMAPEQVEGRIKDVDHQSDIFALGIMLYQCLTGKLPFKAETLPALYKQIIEETPISPRKISKRVPLQLEAACLKAMEKKKKNRYDDAMILARILEKFLSHKRDFSSKKQHKVNNFLYWLRANKQRAIIIAVIVAVLISGIAIVLIPKKSYISDQNKEKSYALSQQADDFLKAKDWEKAISLYSQALKKDPKSFTAILGLAKAYTKVEKYSKAQKLLKRALKIRPDLEVHLEFAKLWLAQGKLESALRQADYIISKKPDNAIYYRFRAKILQKQGKNTQADLKRAYELEETQNQKRFTKIKKLMLEQKWTPALAVLETIEKKQGSDVQTLQLKSQIYSGQQKWTDALGTISKAIELRANARLYLMRAQIALEAKFYEEIATDLRYAKEGLSPQDTILFSKISAEFALKQGDYATAYHAYQSLLAQGIKAPELIFNCGLTAQYLEKYGKALEYFDEVFSSAMTPGDIRLRAQLHRGIVYRHMGRFNYAISDLENVKKSKNALAFLHLGACYLATDNLTKAYTMLSKAKEKMPYSAVVRSFLGEYHLKKGAYQKAISELQICIKQVPWNAKYYFLYGECLYKSKQQQKAVKYLQRSLELDPGNLGPLFTLLSCYMENGSIREVLDIPAIYNSYFLHFLTDGEIEDLFRDQYNILNRHYQEQSFEATKKQKNYQKFLDLLEKHSSETIHKIAISALSSFYKEQQLLDLVQNKIQDFQQQGIEKKTLLWKRVLAKLQKKKREAAIENIRKLIVRLIIGRDPEALKQLDKWGKTGEELLKEIIKSPKENILLRFLACRALLEYATISSYLFVHDYLEKNEESDVAVLCAVALKERKFPVSDKILAQGTKSSQPFLRALVAQQINNVGVLAKLLRDPDERVRVYSANRLLKKHIKKYQSKCYAILARGCNSENPFVRIYSCAKLWPKKVWKDSTRIHSAAFVRKYRYTLVKAIKDPHPLVKRVAAARIGSYSLYNLSSHLLKLLDSRDQMTRYQALTSLAWLKRHKEQLFAIAYNGNEPLLLRSTVMQILFSKIDATLIKNFKRLFEENDPKAGVLALCFVGGLGGGFASFLILPYLDHENHLVRMAAAGGLMHSGTPSLKTKLKTLLKDATPHVRQAAAASLVQVTLKQSKKASNSLYRKMLKRGKNIRAGASVGYYFAVYRDILVKILVKDVLDVSIVEKYDPFRYKDVIDFLYEYYYLGALKKEVRSSQRKYQDYLWRLSRAIKLYPESRYLLERALLYEMKEKWSQAIADMHKAIKLDPKHTPLYSELARILFKSKQYKQVLQITDKLNKLTSRSTNGWYYRAKAFYTLKNLKKARKSFLKAYILEPENEEYYVNIGVCDFEMKNYKKAENIFKYSKSSKRTVLYLARIYMKLKRSDLALKTLKYNYKSVPLKKKEILRYAELKPLSAYPWIRKLK